MRAGKRSAIAVLAAGLALGPAAALAQSTPDSSTSTPAADSIGPRELQNFSLSGTVTRPADQPPTPAPAARKRAAAEAPAISASAVPAAQPKAAEPRRETPSLPTSARAAPQPQTQVASTTALPPVDTATPSSTPSAAATPALATTLPEPASTPASLAPEHNLLLWPWLLAALAIIAGAAFLFRRNRARPLFAGGPQIDAFVAPEPAPVPRPKAPSPAPPQPKPAPSGGIVSTGLRPWIEVAMQPLRCILDEQQVTFEFELELLNSGSAPARGVLVEASLFNAGPTQDQDIGAFMARPIGQGERIYAIQPLERMALRTQVVAPRANIQLLEIAGRQVFVPLIAFNALYRMSGGEGQTSLAYLLGRDTKSAKLAPFRADLGPRVFRGLGARLLPAGVRR